MSDSSSPPRVVRNDPGLVFRKTKYRKALSYLLSDFENRCAYSMEYVGPLAEVDHFNPHRKNDKIQDYQNLFPSSRHCNGKKGSSWPSEEMQSNGIRFLDCTKEADYGECIFENLDNHELVGTTPAAKWQISQMDLNAPFLVRKRRQRYEFNRLLSQCPVIAKKTFSQMAAMSGQLEICYELRDEMIPLIPEPPK